MGFISLLLLAIIWLLWIIHRDLSKNNDRQHNLKTTLSKVAHRFEQALDQQYAEKKASPPSEDSSKSHDAH